MLSGSACPSPRSRASPDARRARTQLPSTLVHPGAGRPPGSALRHRQHQVDSAPVTAPRGRPPRAWGAPVLPAPAQEPLTQPALQPGSRHEPRSSEPPHPEQLSSWASPHPPEADRGPLSGRPATCSQHARGASLKGWPVDGGWRGPPHPSRTSFSTGRPCALLLWLWCRRAAGRPGPGLGGLCPAGTEGARPRLAAGPVCRRLS